MKKAKEKAIDVPTSNRRKLMIPPEKVKFPGLKWPPQDYQDQLTLADELLEWTYVNEVMDLDPFPLSKGMNPYKFYHIDNEYFQYALQASKYIVSGRLKKKFEQVDIRNFVQKQLNIYHPEYRSMIERTLDKVNQVGTIIVQDTLSELVRDASGNQNKTQSVPTETIPEKDN